MAFGLHGLCILLGRHEKQVTRRTHKPDIYEVSSPIDSPQPEANTRTDSYNFLNTHCTSTKGRFLLHRNAGKTRTPLACKDILHYYASASIPRPVLRPGIKANYTGHTVNILKEFFSLCLNPASPCLPTRPPLGFLGSV